MSEIGGTRFRKLADRERLDPPGVAARQPHIARAGAGRSVYG